jgi:hypothetical protein
MKHLTQENWLDVDPIIASGVFVRFSLADGSSRRTTPADWTERLLALQLDPTVPTEVRELYAVARGAMLYGSLFYPLFTLGLEQVARVAEAAATAQAARFAIPSQTSKRKHKDFRTILDDLLAQGVLAEEEHDQWTTIRQFRNLGAHPRQITILPPGAAIGLLGSLTETINRLFS